MKTRISKQTDRNLDSTAMLAVVARLCVGIVLAMLHGVITYCSILSHHHGISSDLYLSSWQREKSLQMKWLACL